MKQQLERTGTVRREPGTDISRIEQTTTTHAPSTPTANIRRRRYQHGAMLLTSPPRPGHTSQMKHIFEQVDIGTKTSRGNELLLYPQLPNISRPSSPPTQDQICSPVPQYRGQASLLPPKEPLSAAAAIDRVNRNPASASESSSGSWSDDSGYIVHHNARPLAAPGSPAHRIQNWLFTVSHGDEESEGEAVKGKPRHADVPPQAPFQQEILHPATTVDDIQQPSSNLHILNQQMVQQRLPCDIRVSPHDPFVFRPSSDGSSVVRSATTAESFHRPPPSTCSQRHNSDACKRLLFDFPGSGTGIRSACTPSTPKALGRLLSDSATNENGEIELSPLSPNVCIERGPARYHTAHNARLNTLPQKASTLTSIFMPPRYSDDWTTENNVADENRVKTVRPLSNISKNARVWPSPSSASRPAER